MIRILIVDDEKIERSGICFLLKKIGVEAQVREAVNGVKALEQLEKEEADILLTDIKMPFMDGITLISRVADKYPSMKIVIFSGYGEFEYAKKAMQYHVSHYILKPVDPAEFEKTMQEIVKELETDRLARKLHEESAQFLQEHRLLSEIYGICNSQEESGIAAKDATSAEYHVMMLLDFNREFFGRRSTDFAKQLQQKIDRTFFYVNLNPEQAVLLFPQKEPFAYETLADAIQDAIAQLFGETGYLAVSEYSQEPLDLHKTYESLEVMMENKFYLPDSHIFLTQETQERSETHAVEDDVLLKQLRQDIHLKDMVGLDTHFAAFCEKYKGETVFSQMYVKFVFSNLMKDIYDSLPDKGQGELNQAVDQLYRANDFSEVMEILETGIRRMKAAFQMNPQMMHREIETVKEYIYANYDKELSVDMLAEQVYMAPSYLSHIFKKETGQNLSKFIKSLRMEKAKEMLTQTHNKIVNISYAVGYPNVSYFCQSFREYFGVSPQKYRTQGDDDAVH